MRAKLKRNRTLESAVGIAAANPFAGPAAWLSAACAPACAGEPRLQRRSGEGRRAALVEAACGAGIASHVLLDEGGEWQDVAVFDGRVEAMEWQGADLLLAIAADSAMRVFSVFPGMRLRDAAGPGEWRWLRLSIRRARR
jgi:hypothetical protein